MDCCSLQTWVAVLLVIITALWWVLKYPKNYPPGPMGVPILGYIKFLGEKPHETLVILAKQYGGTFSLRMGFTDVVVVSDWNSVKEAMGTNMVTSSGIADTLMTQMTTKGKGFAFINGVQWSEQRRFFVQTMGKLGMGKKSHDNIVISQVNALVEHLKQVGSNPINTDELFYTYVLNCIWSIVSDIPIDDAFVKRISKVIKEEFKLFGISFALNFAPSLYHWFGLEKHNAQMITELTDEILAIMNEQIRQHKMADDSGNDDFIDIYLKEIEKRKHEAGTTFSEENLATILNTVFQAGMETIVVVLRWFFLYMACYTEIQREVQKEIRDIIGNRTITSEDKNMLPFTDATLTELLRITTVVPINDFHKATEDTTLAGYYIPKGTLIMPNYWSVHFDEKIFPEPHEFRPQRFYNKDGSAMTKSPHLLTFSMGKRVCPGESLSKMELFLFFATMLQHFSITLPANEPRPDLNDGITGAVVEPPPHKLIFTNFN